MADERAQENTLQYTIAYAGFWRRFLAALVDWIVLNLASTAIAIVALGIFYIFRFGIQAGPEAPSFWAAYGSMWEQVFEAVVYFCLAFPYYVIGHYRYGTTLGKWPLGIKVVRAGTLGPISYGRSLGRFFAYLLSYLPMGCGFLMGAFQPEKRALHDLAAGTVSIVRIRVKK